LDKKPKHSGKRSRQQPPSGGSVNVRRVGDAWELVHPRCTRERSEDMEEVRQILAAGEIDVAIDELRWLLEECSEFMEAHRMLGELVLEADRDVPLARGHFGFAYQLGLAALRRSGNPAPLLYEREANQDFFEAGKGLAYCLSELGKQDMAREVLEQLLHSDPTGPLGLAEMLEGL
jgi:tetratricopeptide (TPR) repeat protein